MDGTRLTRVLRCYVPFCTKAYDEHELSSLLNLSMHMKTMRTLVARPRSWNFHLESWRI